jgi:hypothetical protein
MSLNRIGKYLNLDRKSIFEPNYIYKDRINSLHHISFIYPLSLNNFELIMKYIWYIILNKKRKFPNWEYKEDIGKLDIYIKYNLNKVEQDIFRLFIHNYTPVGIIINIFFRDEVKVGK